MISVYYGIFTVPSIPKLTHTDYINRCTFRTTHWNTVNVSHPIPGWLLCLGGWMELGYLKFNVATFKVIHVTIRWRKIKNTDLGFVYIRLIFFVCTMVNQPEKTTVGQNVLFSFSKHLLLKLIQGLYYTKRRGQFQAITFGNMFLFEGDKVRQFLWFKLILDMFFWMYDTVDIMDMML